jgi:hypothetical protein
MRKPFVRAALAGLAVPAASLAAPAVGPVGPAAGSYHCVFHSRGQGPQTVPPLSNAAGSLHPVAANLPRSLHPMRRRYV